LVLGLPLQLLLLAYGLNFHLLPGLELAGRAEMAMTAGLAVLASHGPPEPSTWPAVAAFVVFGALRHLRDPVHNCFAVRRILTVLRHLMAALDSFR
jgi:hypothetical protein